jgi:riboflavin biosynthesis pyrimidine reductase
MSFRAPADLTPFEVLFDASEPNAALPAEFLRFAGNVGFPDPPGDRPWVFANFVQSLDGLVSFGGTRPGGEWIARSLHDRWMMDLLRAHADAVICGAHSLVLEARYGKIPGGPVYRIVDPDLLRLREEVLGRGKQTVIIATGSGRLRPQEFRLFHSEHVDAWIATTREGREHLGDVGKTHVLAAGTGTQIDWQELVRRLRSESGIRYLLCEGGPTLYGAMLRERLIDEKFLTISPQEIGAGFPESMPSEERQANAGATSRPTALGGPGFTVETAPWYRWIGSRRAGHHAFNRYRAAPPGEQPPATTARI